MNLVKKLTSKQFPMVPYNVLLFGYADYAAYRSEKTLVLGRAKKGLVIINI